MAVYSWVFSAPASPITITDGTNTYTYTGTAIPLGGYSYTVTDFNENDEVTISAVGYNRVTATVGDVTIVMTEMPEVEVLNPNGTSYAVADAKARQRVADLETNVYNDLQNFVTLDTPQTITGQKTLENDSFTQIISGTGGYAIRGRWAKGDTPTGTDFAQFKYQDNSGDSGTAHRYGVVDFVVGLDKKTTATLRVYQNVAGSTSFAQIGVSIAPDGTTQTIAPPCTETNSIVTTTGMSKGTNGYVKLGNGIIIQWGYAQNIAAGSAITLPTPFTSTNYGVVASMRYNAATGVTACGVYGETTTQFRISKQATGNAYYRWIAIGY